MTGQQPATPPSRRDWRAAAARAVRPTRRLAARFAAADVVGLQPPGTVRPGSRPRRVKLVQRVVNQVGPATVDVDGVYGESTHQAVCELQRRLRLPVTGLADPLTLSAGLARAESRQRGPAGPSAPVEPRRVVLALPTASPDDAGRPTLPHMLLEAAPHQYLPRKLVDSGIRAFEAESTSCFIALLEALGGPGPVFDVGANVGLFSYLAQAVCSWDVVAFEPTPDLAHTVRRSAEASGLQVRVEERAMGRVPGVATFFLSDGSDLSSSLNPGFRPSSRQLVVPVDTLDAYVERTGTVPRVVKIDTESTDTDVLGGGKAVIAQHRPWVFVEVLDDHGGALVQAELEGQGYTYYPLHPGLGVEPRDTIVGRNDGRPWNWLLAPEPLPADFEASVTRWRAALKECGPVQPS